MKDTIIYSQYDIGDTLYLMVRTSDVNPGYVIASGVILDIVTCTDNGRIAYKMRLSDGTLTVEDASRCYKHKNGLKCTVLASIDKDIVILERLRNACADEVVKDETAEDETAKE